MTVHFPRKHLVLLGAGRAHMQVLQGLARQGENGVHVTLVAPLPYYIEAAMLPGYLAGAYALEDIRVPLEHLLQASGASFAEAQVRSLDPVARRVQLSSGDALPYDVLSIDVEPTMDRDEIEAWIPGAHHNALFARPLESFVHLWPRLRALARERALHVAVIGYGLPGAELAMATAQALALPHGCHVTLLTGDAPPLLDVQPPALQRRLLARLKALNITALQDHCVSLGGGTLQLTCGARLECDAAIVSAGDSAPDWLLQSGLRIGNDGLPVVNGHLQSASHRQVFVAPPEASDEIGAALLANLRIALGGGAFRKVPATLSCLKVVAGGGGHAIAVWGRLSLEGREVWHWKDRRDRRHLAALVRP